MHHVRNVVRSVLLALLATAAWPALASAEIAVTTECSAEQGQSGHVIRMSIWVEAAEALTVDGHGKVGVRGKTYPLVPRFPTPRPMGAQEGLNFKLVPATAKIAAKVAHALNDGARAEGARDADPGDRRRGREADLQDPVHALSVARPAQALFSATSETSTRPPSEVSASFVNQIR